MKRWLMITFFPGFAACRHKSVASCGAPITVFWIAGIAAIGYGTGVTGTDGYTAFNMPIVMLGLSLWIAASVWTYMTVRGVTQELCNSCEHVATCTMKPQFDESDPFEQVRSIKE